jgi:hypothetical protein
MRPRRLLSLCFPTFGSQNELHLNSRNDAVVLAPDEFNRILVARGWEVDVVSLGPLSEHTLFRSKLSLRALSDVDFDSYDVYWHMLRDPTQPEVLDIIQKLNLDYSGKPVINHIDRLRHHNKHHYARILFDAGIGSEILPTPADRSDWIAEESCRVSPDGTMIESCAYNNNRGDYPGLRNETIVQRYIDNAVDGLRSMVRFGYAYGSGFTGFKYFSRRMAFKSGGAERREAYTVDEKHHASISKVVSELGVDVCHIDAIPVGDQLMVIDINPYPTSNGSTLSPITESLVDILERQFQ